MEKLPHDPSFFTQGLSLFNGSLYEGSGMNGQSKLRKLDMLDPSKPLEEIDLPHEFFGEGITPYKNGLGEDRLIQITWRERTAFVYDPKSFKLLFQVKYHKETSNGEGWGITYDQSRNEFIMSDGTTNIFFWDVKNLDSCETSVASIETKDTNETYMCDVVIEATRSIDVKAILQQQSETPIPVQHLNELEFLPISTIKGHDSPTLLANVWYQQYILEIDIESGEVLKLFDLATICPTMTSENVLNGISISDEGNDILWITGKLWDSIYKIRIY